MLEKERWSVGYPIKLEAVVRRGLVGVREFFGALMRRLMR
jgi:hypothetical protein